MLPSTETAFRCPIHGTPLDDDAIRGSICLSCDARAINSLHGWLAHLWRVLWHR